MKKFILSSLLFGFIVIALFVLIIAGVSYKIQNTPCLIDSSKNVLVLGNSRPEGCVDDSVLSHWINVSSSGEPIELTYRKLVYLLKFNPHIDTVMLEISRPQFFEGHINFNQSSRRFLKKWHLMSFDEWVLLLSHRIDYSKISLKKSLSLLFAQEIDPKHWGKYYNKFYQKSNLEIAIQERINRLEENKNIPPILYPNSIKYLNLIASACRENNKTLIFFQTPYYKYMSFFPNDNFYPIIHQNFSEIPFFDYRDLPLADSCFYDLAHLRYCGTKVFTEQLQKDFYGKHPESNEVGDKK